MTLDSIGEAQQPQRVLRRRRTGQAARDLRTRGERVPAGARLADRVPGRGPVLVEEPEERQAEPGRSQADLGGYYQSVATQNLMKKVTMQ